MNEESLFSVITWLSTHHLLSTSLIIFLVFACYYLSRPIFSTLYGPILLYPLKGEKNVDLYIKCIFRVFITYFFISILFAFFACFFLVVSKLLSSAYSIDDIKNAIDLNSIAPNIKSGHEEIAKLLFEPMKQTIKIFGIIGVLTVSTTRILSVFYNTFMIPTLLRQTVIGLALVSVCSIFSPFLMTTLTDSMKVANFETPFALLLISGVGFSVTEILIFFSARHFSAARKASYWLQRQRKEVFEIEEQLFSRKLYLEKWKHIIGTEIRRNGINDLRWLSYSFDGNQIKTILEAAEAFYRDSEQIKELGYALDSTTHYL